MEILIIFETGEGQTRKIAGFIADLCRNAGHGVRLHDTADKSAAPQITGADRVILAAPVHERRHPRMFEAMVHTARDQLAARPSLMVSVSLKAAFHDGLDEARDYLQEMEMRTGFTPTAEALVAGAVRMTSYDYYQSQIVRHVALAGHDVTLTDGVREFTDWDALRATVTAFLVQDGTAPR
ncbi:MAG: flavodoxin domain-containing protein [Roseinatronobacter sp.]